MTFRARLKSCDFKLRTYLGMRKNTARFEKQVYESSFEKLVIFDQVLFFFDDTYLEIKVESII